mmetsp:Transcript_37345/g.111550  ORF Transcript_37345/g.111550 Transcript_37345/m.111550 type:complete len:203 (+) Transcript_37345:1150-1758(+)
MPRPPQRRGGGLHLRRVRGEQECRRGRGSGGHGPALQLPAGPASLMGTGEAPVVLQARERRVLDERRVPRDELAGVRQHVQLQGSVCLLLCAHRVGGASHVQGQGQALLEGAQARLVAVRLLRRLHCGSCRLHGPRRRGRQGARHGFLQEAVRGGASSAGLSAAVVWQQFCQGPPCWRCWCLQYLPGSLPRAWPCCGAPRET